MALQSRDQIIEQLIEHIQSMGPEYENYMARAFDYELDRMKLTLWGFTEEQLEESKAWRRRTNQGIFREYFEGKSNQWLRELHRRDVKQTHRRELA